MPDDKSKYPVNDQESKLISASYAEPKFREGDRVKTYDHHKGTVTMVTPYAGDMAVTIQEDSGRERVLFQDGEIDNRPQIEKVSDTK